ncbi:MAG: hypothetical protein CMJ76_10610 [Planctomycetaceae bacterium]|nr:hypothetical protein [Planctomycetaceae bacterium]
MNLSRRDAIKGFAAVTGLTGGDSFTRILSGSEESSMVDTPKIQSCIIVFYYGGPSHLDMFDLKPDAPDNIRGVFKPISTSVPGTLISELLPEHAKIMHKVALVRSMHHTNRLHDSASTEILTGRQSPQGDREEFQPIPQFYPAYGAALAMLRRQREIEIPFAALPWVFKNVIPVPCQWGGFLGNSYDPFQISGDAGKVTFSADAFKRPSDLPILRLKNRQQLLNAINEGTDISKVTSKEGFRTHLGKALKLMQSTSLAKALTIEEESESTRQSYGLYDEKPPAGVRNVAGHQLRGQNLLLARRLVEAGVSFINVYDFRQQGQNWDSHVNNFPEHKDRLVPPMDKSFAALINDLDQRGLLDTTLVIGMGEFGRTPKINPDAGRDHWPDCYSIVLAGGGVKGGMVYGASDRIGAYPIEKAVTPADLAATIYWRFGINSNADIHDQTGRPHRLADGNPITELFES